MYSYAKGVYFLFLKTLITFICYFFSKKTVIIACRLFSSAPEYNIRNALVISPSSCELGGDKEVKTAAAYHHLR